MKVTKTEVTKLMLTDLDKLDAVAVIAEDIAPRQGKITITCYGKSWTAFWGGMGDQNISEFFRSADNGYLMGYLSPNTPSQITDIDSLMDQAEQKGIDCCRHDPWNDHEFMAKMFGDDMADWGDSLPKIENHEYQYICRIIDAVKSALGSEAAS